jgi:hypothetical protein
MHPSIVEFWNILRSAKMIKPSIGRVVLVYRGINHEGTQWNTAQICFVHNDQEIAVAGFTKHGRPFTETWLKLRQDDVATNAIELPLNCTGNEPFACWMPYQRKVAGANS